MASADFYNPIPPPLDAGSTEPKSGQDRGSPRVRRTTFIPYTRRIHADILPDDYWALDGFAPSAG